MNNDVVIYQSGDGLVKMEALVDAANETIWATQKAMASLFACSKQNVSYHLSKIFSSGELDQLTVVKEILTTVQSGVRGLSEEKILYYNLDAIISVGYRINSVKATAFRQWATSVLKQYTIKGYAINQNAVSEQKYEDLKRAVGLLENVFSHNLVLTSQQATELFDVVRDYTYVHWTPWMPMITRVWKYLTPLFKRSSELHTRVQWKQSLALRKNSEKASCSE